MTGAAATGDQGRSAEGGPRWLRPVIARAERFQQGRPWVAVPVATVKKFGEDRAGNLAGLIAYYGFFSLFPLLLVLVTAMGFVLSGNEQLQRDILDSALAQFPVIGQQLQDNTGELTTSGFALIAGSASALWAGTGVIKAAQDAMNDVWDVPLRQRPNMFVAIARSFGMLALLGSGIVLTALLTGAVGAGSGSFLARALGVVIGTVLNIGLFLLAFRVLTVRDVALRDLLPGALVAGVAWMVLQLVGGYLIDTHLNKASDVYGTFAVVIGLLWWLYIQAQVVLLAAELNVVLTNHLWPRSLAGDDRPPDRRTLEQHAEVEERVPGEEVRAEFDGGADDPAHPAGAGNERGA